LSTPDYHVMESGYLEFGEAVKIEGCLDGLYAPRSDKYRKDKKRRPCPEYLTAGASKFPPAAGRSFMIESPALPGVPEPEEKCETYDRGYRRQDIGQHRAEEVGR